MKWHWMLHKGRPRNRVIEFCNSGRLSRARRAKLRLWWPESCDSIRRDGRPIKPPACILIGGETTVTLGTCSGKGGRNQEFVLALLHKLGLQEMKGVAVLSGGTDGEDGPTDAAGAVADEEIYRKAIGLDRESDIGSCLAQHDAYSFFDATGGLIRTGLTETNVMDVRVVLVR